MIDFTKSSNTQLLTIVNHDNECPAPLWSGAVIEAINRNLFDGIIVKSIKSVMIPDVVEKIHKISMEDFMQIGRMEIFKIKDRFKFDKGKTFALFAYYCVRQRIIKVIRDLERSKRDNRKVVSYQEHENIDDEFEVIFLDRQTNVESYVVNKIYVEQLLNQLNTNQRMILHYHLEGYTFAEISQLLGRGNRQSMHESYTAAIKKMRKGA